MSSFYDAFMYGSSRENLKVSLFGFWRILLTLFYLPFTNAQLFYKRSLYIKVFCFRRPSTDFSALTMVTPENNDKLFIQQKKFY